MAKDNAKLLTVEDSFLIEGRGVIVLPMITDYRGPMSLSVVLRKPDGVECIGMAYLDIPLLNNGRNAHEPYLFFCLLANMNTQDVPIGTEIWVEHGNEN